MINDDICYCARTLIMQGTDERTQFRLASPVAIEVAVLLGDVARAAAGLRARREPDEVEVRANLLRLTEHCAPAVVAIAMVLITIPVERLQHDIGCLGRHTLGRHNDRCAC